MNIAVYCSSSNRIAEHYKQAAFRLGEYIAESGNTLVYGGATGGLMDAVAQGAHSKNGQIIGVIAEAIIRMKRQSLLPTKLITVENMSKRKEEMKNFSDIFIALPGSFGTLDEMFDVVASGVVGEHKKPFILLNHKGFYDYFLKQIDLMHEEEFMPVEENYKPVVVKDVDHCINLLEGIIKSHNNKILL